ncbi:hypothetical protein Vafri_141 [Volvox africanus]|nr:hypothetical protein Vafri_141 [Volvox africanus]
MAISLICIGMFVEEARWHGLQRRRHQMAEAGFVGAPAKAPSISENYNMLFQQPTPSIGTPEMGTSYLDLLDNIADPSVLKAGPSKDSQQLELERFIAANLSGAFCAFQ